MSEKLDYRVVDEKEILRVDQFNLIGVNRWVHEFFSPLMGPSFLCGCYNESNEVIGTEGYIGYRMNYGDKEILTHRSERTLVSSNYRGKGIFNILIDRCDTFAQNKKSCLVWGATSALKPFANAGFQIFTGFRSYVFYPIVDPISATLRFIKSEKFTIDVRKIIKAYRTKELKTLIEFAGYFSTWNVTNIFLRSLNKSKIKMKEDYLNIEDVSELREIVFGKSNMYSICIDQGFISWLNRTGNTYRFFSFYEQNKLVGYLVSQEDAKKCVLRIVDFCFLNEDWIKPILFRFHEYIKNTNYISLLTVLNVENNLQNAYKNTLANLGGFLFNGFGSFVVKNFINDYHQFDGIGQLYLTDIWFALGSINDQDNN